jgi:hypothetical protein
MAGRHISEVLNIDSLLKNDGDGRKVLRCPVVSGYKLGRGGGGGGGASGSINVRLDAASVVRRTGSSVAFKTLEFNPGRVDIKYHPVPSHLSTTPRPLRALFTCCHAFW